MSFLTRNKHFSIFKLLNNGMGPSGGTVVANALLENAKSTAPNAKIATVICGRNRLENGSAPFFAKAYSALGASLREVRMVQNGIRMEGISALAKGLQACPNLELLDLQDNTAAYSGSRSIAQALKAWPKLKHLNLSDCLLRPRGALTLMTALMNGHNVELESLKLQSDEIDAKSINILADAVKVHLKHLPLVELNGNRVEAEDESMMKLREALESNGFEGAVDDIDDVEEVDEEEEEAEEEDVQSEEDEIENKAQQTVIAGTAEKGGEDVRANEADIVKQDKVSNVLALWRMLICLFSSSDCGGSGTEGYTKQRYRGRSTCRSDGESRNQIIANSLTPEKTKQLSVALASSLMQISRKKF